MRTLMIVTAAAAALASACASPSAYHARSENGRFGYADMQVEPNRAIVSFNGDTTTSREDVEMYLFYRAAELTLERGHDYFVVAGHDVDAVTRFESSTFRARAMSSYYEISSHNATLDIVMFDGERPASAANAYDARALRDSLGPRVAASQQN